MKFCRTLNGLLKSIEKGEKCCMKYTSSHISGNGGYIIYQSNGTNLIVNDETYKKIKPYLKQV